MRWTALDRAKPGRADARERKFSAVEAASEKMHRDSVVFRDAVTCEYPLPSACVALSSGGSLTPALLDSGSSFSGALATLFSPISGEYDIASKFPNAEVTVKNISSYQGLMDELRETLSPELELIESRIVLPSKELSEICKRIRKTIVKREHKLQDYDRHNNNLNKLRAKSEKSLSDEKNLFKTEESFELASGEYEHFNNLLKTEMPAFLAMGTRFIDPLFHSFYYMQLNVYYIMLEKLQSFSDGKYDLERRDIEDLYFEQRGDAAEQLDALQITKRTQSTGELCTPERS